MLTQRASREVLSWLEKSYMGKLKAESYGRCLELNGGLEGYVFFGGDNLQVFDLCGMGQLL